MPTISYRVNPSNGIKYAYSVTSYWDKEKKAPRTKRTYLGRVDPDSGEIIPPSSGKGRITLPPKAARNSSGESEAVKKLYEELEDKEKVIKELQGRLHDAEALAVQLQKKIERIAAIATSDKI